MSEDALEDESAACDVHPRERYLAERLGPQAVAFEEALRRERLHHAWLLTGPKGVGKAAFAYRAARRLLGAAPAETFGPLGADPEDPVSRLIASQSHPDLMALEPVRRDIPVEHARRLPEFFQKSSGLGGYRVAIIDAAEDLNLSGANALLKTLEEPSQRGVLFLVSHAPGRLLPTIRSRCRVLRFALWTEAELEDHLLKDGVGASEAGALARVARGSPGRAKRLLSDNWTALDPVVRKMMGEEGPPSSLELVKLSEGFRGADGALKFRLLLERLSDAASQRAKTLDRPASARWAELFGWLSSLPGRSEAVNLDRIDAFFAAYERISQAQKI